jgi:hypothetical protein
MENKKNNFMGDIYTSYGPFVGKVCENTNTLLYQDYIIESVTSSITENSINKDLLNSKTMNIVFPDDNLKKSEYQIEDLGKTKIFKQFDKNNNHNSTIKTGGELSKVEAQTQVQINNNIEDESNNFFNYKVSIFNFKISIWILILILLIIVCIGYFIYKYWYLKNTNIITYKKNSLIESENKSDNNKNRESINSNKFDNNKNIDLYTENTTTDDSSSDLSNSSNNS